jgi:hypothetical protein
LAWRHSGNISSGSYAGAWRTGRSLQILTGQVDSRWPTRLSLPAARAADGTLGDTSHQNRSSDHNPNIADGSYNIVTAVDITDYDPIGQDMAKLTEALRLSRDLRIKYVIHSNRMFSSYPTSSHPAFTWRPYSGPNAHLSHAHISTQPAKSFYDSTVPWKITLEVSMPYVPSPENGPPRKWADEIWQTYVNATGTDPDSRNWLFFREDLSWVWSREIVPLEKKLATQASQIANLQNRIKALETATPSGTGIITSGTIFTATVK